MQNVAQFGTAYQSGYSFVRLTPIIEHESKGCVIDYLCESKLLEPRPDSQLDLSVSKGQ